MARSKNDGPDPAVIARRRKNRASDYRKRVRDAGHGTDFDAAHKAGAITDDQLAFLKEYHAKVPLRLGEADPGDDPGADAAPAGGDGGAPAPVVDSGVPAAAPAPAATGGEAPPDAPAPAPRILERGSVDAPPRVNLTLVKGEGRPSSGRWQDKYTYLGSRGDSGREVVCVKVASYAYGIAKSMARDLQAIGVDPLVDPEELQGAYVLVADQLLPQDFELTPELVAVGGSSALLVQRFINAKAIKEYKDKQKAEDELKSNIQKMKERAAQSSQATSAEPPPAPVAPAPPAPVVPPADAPVPPPVVDTSAPTDTLTEKRPFWFPDGDERKPYPVHELG